MKPEKASPFHSCLMIAWLTLMGWTLAVFIAWLLVR